MRRLSKLATLVGIGAIVAVLAATGCDSGGGGDQGGPGTDAGISPDTTTPPGDATDATTTPTDTTTPPDQDVTTPGPDGGDDTVQPPPKEDCVNGQDDDGDNLVDCADPDCAAKPVCTEADCENGQDDDGDGMVDCDDPDCSMAAACVVMSCGVWYDCLLQKGCDCTIGVDCPTGNQASQCLNACAQNPDCNQTCTDSLTPEYQQKLNDFQQCLQGMCGSVQDDPQTPQDEFVVCIFDNCLVEYAECFQVGDGVCIDFYSCMTGCPDLANPNDINDPANDPYFECQGQCLDELSAEGYMDLVNWDDCRFGLCDADDDSTADSTECLVLASFGACLTVAPTCVGDLVGEANCGTIVDCLLSCETFELPEDPQQPGCIEVCLSEVSDAAAPELEPLMTCAIASCGTTVEELTPACLQAALEGDCAEEAAACTPATPFEFCGNGVDDDGDGLVDCDDEADCNNHPLCGPPEDCTNGIDDDGDGNVDCDDLGCSKDPACAETICDDGEDNDGDGAVDCDDDDCAMDPACAPPVEVCDDGEDNDGDGAVDCDDDDCAMDPACAPPMAYAFVIVTDGLTECTSDADNGSPGADIDAVTLASASGDDKGSATMATLTGGGLCATNDYGDAMAATGASDGAYVSLNGGQLVVSFGDGVMFEDGDVLTIYEVDTDGAETYTVELSVDEMGTQTLELGTGGGQQSFTITLM